MVALIAMIALCLVATKKIYDYLKSDTAITRMGLIRAVNIIVICEFMHGLINFFAMIIVVPKYAFGVLVLMITNISLFFQFRKAIIVYYFVGLI